ncbi:MAG TPA: hypothetical protein VHK65_17780 [Candidatus Dormibacteraeota bacterium]|nr:hypothetical protein [Candidatus Dormibacteraeota bacterium]
MKSQDQRNLRAKSGVSRLWLGVAAVAGAAIAYLGDRERGNARRQAALHQLSGAAQAAVERTSRWRGFVSSRLPGRVHGELPAQVTVPSEPTAAATAPSRSKRAERSAEPAAETKKPESLVPENPPAP